MVTAISTPAQDKLKKIISDENEILLELYRKRDIGQLPENDETEIKDSEEKLRKYRANLKSQRNDSKTSAKIQKEF